jgi:peptidyl-prolyl cis-trans isomerase SurA
MKSFLALILFAALGALAPAAHAQLLPQYQTQPLDRIVAVVDDDVILQSELDQAVQTVLQQYSGDPSQLPPHDVLNRQVLERLILQRLQVHRASDGGIRVTQSEVENAISGIAQQNHMSVNDLASAVSDQGTSFHSFQQQVADQIVVQKLRQQVLQGVQVTDSEIDNLLASPTFKAGEVHLAHIVVNLDQGANADDIAKAQAKAEEIEKQLAGGADFNATAIRYSEGADALEGGDLGWRNLDEVPTAFVSTIEKMQPGQVSEPLRGPNGFQILKLIDRRAQQATVVTEYHARHIMIRPSALVTDAQAEEKVEALRKRIVDGHEDFAALAKKNSDDDTTANQGGDMGWFPIDGWGTDVETQIRALKDNEVSLPFKTGGGWDIIQLLGKREQDRTAEVQREQAHQAIENRKAEDTYNNFLRDLRAQAYIENRLDPSASTGGASSAL